MSTNPKICNQCKWHVHDSTYSDDYRFFYCKHPELTVVNMINGEQDTSLCRTLRESGKPCGPEGKYWEKREVTATDDDEGFNLFWVLLFGVLASCVGLGVFIGVNLDIKGTSEVHDANTIIQQNTNIRRSFK